MRTLSTALPAPGSPRFAQEYKKEPDRGYGAGVITVFKKLLSPKCRDVFEPARAQFNGKGSYGNGGAMRVAGISLAYSSVQEVQKVGRAGWPLAPTSPPPPPPRPPPRSPASVTARLCPHCLCPSLPGCRPS